ncbi:MAG TPA: methionyl-tRNA formyltransferase [Gemmatimonadaceae bacterium]|nr:methionyl-tRNA formyltransferase [Gemmatimonadaceae bacterium]
MRVLFWGTPEFATPALRALLGEGHDIVGVVTQPDAPDARHRSTLIAPPVKRVADEEGIPVFQPERPRGDVVDQLRALDAEISVVVAYGHVLSDEVINVPPNGTLNIHASLLPRWRGAAPIQAALLAGDAETGVTIMRVVKELDAGPTVLRLTTPIPDDETCGELQLRLAELGALGIVEALALIEIGEAREEPQDNSLATYAPKIEREMARVDWSQSATQISRVMRAFDPRPGAFTHRDGTEVKLFGARVALGRHGGVAPGTVMEIDESGMLVACGEDALRVGYVFPAGRRRLAALDWHQGRGVAVGDVLGT